MRSSLVSGTCLALLTLSACRKEGPAADAMPAPQVEAPSPATAGASGEELPDVQVRGWTLVQQPYDAHTTQVQVWAPGDHLKEAYSALVTDLYRQHAHFADWADGSLFVVTRHGSVENGDWNDGLWEFREDKEPRRLLSGRGIDFRASPDGKLLAVSVADSGGPGEWVRVLDRTGKVLRERSMKALEWEDVENLWMGDSVLYLEAGEELKRWDLRSDSVAAVALPKGASLWDYAILPDRDLLVSSNVLRDPDEAKGKPVVLSAFGLRSGRRSVVAQAVGRTFHPRFAERDSLEYEAPIGDGEVRTLVTLP